MLFSPRLLFLLHPARTVLQTFPGVPSVSIHSHILWGWDPPPKAQPGVRVC